jgi:arginine kinase
MGCNSSKGVSETSGKPSSGRTTCGTQLKTPEDLTGFPKFPADCKSLVSKHLTKDIWDSYHNKSDAAGVSFKTCVFSGCQNVDSGIGCYAGSEDSYKTFSNFFDKIIQEYHGHSPTDNHVSDMNAESLNCPPFSAEEAAMIKSTRIRVGRNLAEYPLGPGITNEQRNEIMQKVVTACNQFEGDLAGTFYPLDGMSAADQQKLIDDNFLFK